MRSYAERGGGKSGTEAEGKKDVIRESFLRVQLEEGRKMAERSDLFQLLPMGRDSSPERYVVRYFCTSLVRDAQGKIGEASLFDVGIWFHEDYQRVCDPPRVVTMLYPDNIFHPNIRFPLFCAGKITCATALQDLIYHVWEILTFRNWASHDGLREEACQWARQNQDRFPTDPRPLIRKARYDFEIEPITE